jgi:type 1 glutamine amidotransferase
MTSIRALLLMGDAHQLHDQPFHYAELAGILAGEGGVELRITCDLGVLSPAQLEQFDVVINWSTFIAVESEQVQALLESVRGGTGFVALHGGNATFWNSAEYLTTTRSDTTRGRCAITITAGWPYKV